MASPPRTRKYEDLRNKFIRGLIKYEHQQRRHQFLKQAAEWTSKAIVSLSLASEPIRSAKQATLLEGVGPTIRAKLDKIQSENSASNEPSLPGQHTSTGSGLLVALLNESEALGSSDGGKPLIAESDLKDACSLICEEKFNVAKPSAYGAPVLCPAWWRINVLISRGYVKKRTRGKKAVYELLAEGLEVAKRLRGNHPPPFRVRNDIPKSLNSENLHSSLPSNRKASSKKKLSSCIASTSANTSSPSSRSNILNTSKLASMPAQSNGPLYCYDNGNDGIIMLVDDHELGGDGMRLGELSRRLKEWSVQHKTAHLPCGDYWWLWRYKGQEITMPVLVERKRADDLAESIKDGRFCSQKNKMRQWRKDFGILYGEVCLHYIVESTPEAYCVKCIDGCGGVGKCGNPTVEQLEVVIMELERSQDFNLIRTENLETTIEFLASVSADLQRRALNGDFEALRLMKQGQHITSTQTPSTKTNLVSKATCSTPNNYLIPSPTSKSDTSTDQSFDQHLENNDFQYLHVETKPKVDKSPVRLGSKRHFSCIEIGFNDDRKPAKIKTEVVDLCDSQDDVILISPFDHVNEETGEHKADGKSMSMKVANQNAHVDANQDEVAKIMSICDVMPDSSMEDILCALSLCGGNVDLAVARLLDNN